MNSKQAKNIAIENYLARQGFTPEREQGNYLWYCSPLRDECTPSFRVNRAFNSWFDYGLGKGGNILDLVMQMLQTNDLSRCLAHLESLETVPTSFSFAQQKREIAQPESKIVITQVQPISSLALLEYLNERAITPDIAKLHCKEVHYSVGDKNYFAVGFTNNSGGWVLRNKYFKGCSSPTGVTTVNKSSDTCLVFEGFMDMLSYLTLKNAPDPLLDIIVLNSVVNLDEAIGFLQRHETIHCFLDNDDAGKQATAEIEKLGRTVVDQSPFYRNFKDLNDYLVGRKLEKLQVIKIENKVVTEHPKPTQKSTRRMKF